MNRLMKDSTGEVLPFISASFSDDVGSWVWTANITLADLNAVNALKPTGSLGRDYVPVSFYIGDELFALIIEEVGSNDTDYSYSAVGRSRTAVLAEPYSLPITKQWHNTTAHSIIAELAAAVAFRIEIIDWVIDSYGVDKRYPIDVISELASEKGAVVWSTPSGILVVSNYPICSPRKLPEYIPDYFISTDKNLFARQRKFVNNKNYNRVLVTRDNQTANAPTVTIEDDADGDDHVLKVFVSPFVDASLIHLTHTSGEGVRFFYEGIHDAECREQILLQNGKAQLSHGFASLISVVWHQDVGGELAIDGTGSVSSSAGFALATIAYTARHHRYRFQRVDHEVDLTGVSVADIPPQSNIAALSVEVVAGNGDRPAPPIVVTTLSSLQSLKERGESFLWPQLCDVDEYQINTLFENRIIVPRGVANVAILSEGLYFNGWIKAVTLNVDLEITQTVTLERSIYE